jgi:pimeloyl-ACP methyl ester carboxylesterase
LLVANAKLTRAVIEQQDGPVLLLGHGYDGAVITAADAHDRVKALVYVAAIEPKRSESTSRLLASLPEPSDDVRTSDDDRLFLDSKKFAADYAADLAFTRTNFMADTQVPATVKAFAGTLPVAARETKPSHAVHMSRPEAVAAVIDQAATDAK